MPARRSSLLQYEYTAPDALAHAVLRFDEVVGDLWEGSEHVFGVPRRDVRFVGILVARLLWAHSDRDADERVVSEQLAYDAFGIILLMCSSTSPKITRSNSRAK